MGRKERTIFITILANLVLIVLRFFLAGLSGASDLGQMPGIPSRMCSYHPWCSLA